MDRGVKNHMDVKGRCSFGGREEGFMGAAKINSLPINMIIIGVNFSLDEITGWEVGWIVIQFIRLPIIILASVKDMVGIERFTFEVLIEFKLKGGSGPVQTIMISRKV